ncbi:MAG: hypothetical protein PVJ28_12515 [Acidimicrobiia bacterium]
MLPSQKVRAVPEQRDARVIRENERAAARREAAEDEPGGLAELLNALAQGLAGLGIPGNRGRGFPASPAY